MIINVLHLLIIDVSLTVVEKRLDTFTGVTNTYNM